MTLRRIEIGGYTKPASHEPGPAPSLLWVDVNTLVIDETYQRRISRGGRRQVQWIVDHFEWSMFSPVIVAPVEGGAYAIIDGQHRTTAAAICGFEKVPCQLVQADRRRQAAAFAAVNGNVQKISTMQVFHAALAAGEEWATDIQTVVLAAGVTVLKYPIAAHLPSRPRHSTMSVRAIQRVIAKHGPLLAAATLRCITRTELGDDPGVLGVRWIGGIGAALADRPKWIADESRLHAFFSDLDAGAAEKASTAYRKANVTSAAEALATVLRQELDLAKPGFAPAATAEAA